MRVKVLLRLGRGVLGGAESFIISGATVSPAARLEAVGNSGFRRDAADAP